MSPTISLAKSVALLPLDRQNSFFEALSLEEKRRLLKEWRFWGRPSQLIPGTPGAAIQRDDWVYWLLLAGRGFGKTRTGAETVREWARNPNERILMVAPIAADVRSVMLEGPSGLLNCYPSDARPVYNPSRQLVHFPSGAVGITRSADEPERLRGHQFTKFWADELCAWKRAKEAWEQIMFGFRLKTDNLRGLITTTPKVTPLVDYNGRKIPLIRLLRDNPKTVTTRGSSYENSDNLSSQYYDDIIKPYEGTRLGRQEIEAELIEEIEGALFKLQLIEAARIDRREIHWEALVRIVVAIDPAVSALEDSDETGIVVAGLTKAGHVIVLGDLSLKDTPANWAKVAIAAYRANQADRIIGEVNNGGDLVERNIRTVDPNVSYRAVRASRGKMVRAQPVAALYEQGRVHHVGFMPKLEEQMCSYVPGVTRDSPDRMDALCWAVTDLVLDEEEMDVRFKFVDEVVISPF